MSSAFFKADPSAWIEARAAIAKPWPDEREGLRAELP